MLLSADSEGIAQFHRVLNDFVLREKLDRKTGKLRDQVIEAALKRILRKDE